MDRTRIPVLVIRHGGKSVFTLAFGVTVVSGLLLHRLLGRPFNPGRLLVLGFVSLFLINISLFCANLFAGMSVMRRAKNEDELERIMVPALQGKPSHLGAGVLEAFRLLTMVSAGLTTGAAVLSVLRLYGF